MSAPILTPIENYLSDVGQDFTAYLKEGHRLCDPSCDLTAVHYSGGNIPNYENPHIQQYYILRYAYAYTFEYKEMYKKLFEMYPPRDELVVFSLGCGARPDYLGLKLAQRETSRNVSALYCGFEMMDWLYPVEPQMDDRVETVPGDVVQGLSRVNSVCPDIIFFPRSLNEILQRHTPYDIFRSIRFTKDRLHILTSLRKEESCRKVDEAFVDEIKSTLRNGEFGFECKSDVDVTFREQDEWGNPAAIRDLDPAFGAHPFTGRTSPNALKLEELYAWCNQCDACQAEDSDRFSVCKENDLGYYPITRVSQVCNRILTFERAR